MNSPENKNNTVASKTSSGLDVSEFLRPEDLAGTNWDRDLGFPGEFPYTRGLYPAGYRSRLWTMRQYAGYGAAADSNARFRYLLGQGQTGLSVAFDLPTQLGLDSDHPQALGEVGRVGVAIASLEDMEALFDGIPLERVTTSMTINATAAILLALYVAVAEKQGANLEKLSGTVQNDILKEYIARGTYIYPPSPALRIVTDIFAFCHERVPEWNTISVSGYHIREAGSTAVQEIAFALSNAIAYVEAARARGLAVDDFAPRTSFFLNAHNDLLEEVAKFRAARRLWARIMRERFQALDIRSQMVRFHAQTAGSTLTAQQPDVNLVRGHAPGARGGSGRNTVAPHQRPRRSTRSADGRLRTPRPPHTADHCARKRRTECRRSSGRLVFPRESHRPHRTGSTGLHPEDRRHGRGSPRHRDGVHFA